MPVPQRVNFLVEQAEKPVHKKLIENGATSQLNLTSCSNINKRIFRGVGRVYRTYLQALRLLANPPLRLIENGARYLLNALQNFLLLMAAKNRE